MTAVTGCGSHYGLQVHWGKVHYVPVCTRQAVRAPDGQLIPPQDSMMYLGATIHGSGRFGCEVARKIGSARADFRTLQTVWNHASVSRHRKVQLFDSLIQSKLRNATASAWLLKADLRRLDGFQAYCLRRILRIPPSFISRVSNETVRKECGMPPISSSIRQAQKALLRRVIAVPAKEELRGNIPLRFHGPALRGVRAQSWTSTPNLGRAASSGGDDK